MEIHKEVIRKCVEGKNLWITHKCLEIGGFFQYLQEIHELMGQKKRPHAPILLDKDAKYVMSIEDRLRVWMD